MLHDHSLHLKYCISGLWQHLRQQCLGLSGDVAAHSRLHARIQLRRHPRITGFPGPGAVHADVSSSFWYERTASLRWRLPL